MAGKANEKKIDMRFRTSAGKRNYSSACHDVCKKATHREGAQPALRTIPILPPLNLCNIRNWIQKQNWLWTANIIAMRIGLPRVSAASMTPPLNLIPITPVPVTIGSCVRVEGSFAAAFLGLAGAENPAMLGMPSPPGRRGS